jgi:hypothetical protein
MFWKWTYDDVVVYLMCDCISFDIVQVSVVFICLIFGSVFSSPTDIMVKAV